MSQIKRIGIDTSKAIFTLHGVDQTAQPVLRINLRRAQMVTFFRKLPGVEIAMEVCASSHYWARELAALGHDVRSIPPQYIKPFVKRGKNDREPAFGPAKPDRGTLKRSARLPAAPECISCRSSRPPNRLSQWY